MKVNPGTVVTVAAQFTLAGAPGKFQPPSSCVSSNAKDKVGAPTDDGAAGISSSDVDGSANATGDSSIYTVTGDGDLGKGVATLSGVSEQVDWTDTVDIEADGVTVAINQLVPSTPAQAAKHKAAVGRR